MKGHTNRVVRTAALAAAGVLMASSVSSAQLAHRWSFTGGSLNDSVGSLTLVNAGGVTFNSDMAIFPGGASTANGYLTVPSGALPTTDISATIETWGGVDANTGIWSRIFDFGQTTTDYWFLTPRGNSAANPQIRDLIKRGNGAEQGYTSGNGATALLSAGGTVQHQTASVFDTTANTLTLYIDGLAFGSVGGVTHTLATFPQNQNYLGKSQYPDPNLLGSLDEVRIYNNAVAAADVLASYGVGPNAIANASLFDFNASNGNIATGSNYAGGVAPGVLDRATIANGGTAVVTGTPTINQVRLTNGTINVAAGNTLSLPGGIDMNPAAGQSATINVTGGTLTLPAIISSTPVTAGTRQLNLSGATVNFTNNVNANVGAGAAISLTGSNTINTSPATVGSQIAISTLTGDISGAGSIVKTGTNVLQLTGNNSFAGNIDITAGQILTGSPTALGSAAGNTTVRTGASLRNNGFRTIAENIVLDGGQLQIGGATQTTFSGNISLTQNYNDLAVPTIVTDGGSNYNFTGNITSSGGDRNAIFAVSNPASVVRGQLNLGAGGSMTIQGGGVFALANDTNVFGLAAIVSGNTLRVGAGDEPAGMLAGANNVGSLTGALDPNAIIVVSDYNALTPNSSSAVEFSRSNNITVGNFITGSGIVRKTNVGILRLTNAGNDFAGGLIVNGGVVMVDPANLQASFGLSPQASNLVNAAGAVAVPAGTNVNSSGVFGKIALNSTGAIALDENSSENFDFAALGFTGLHVGAVVGKDITYSGTETPNGGIYRFGGGGGNLTVASNLTSGTSVEIGGQGTVRLAGANTYTGATVVNNGGTLILNGMEELDASSGLTINGGRISYTAGATGTTDLTTKPFSTTNAEIDTNGNTVTFNGSATTSGGYFTKVGTGTLVFNNANGGTVVAPVNTLNPANFHVRRGTVTLQNKTQITTTGFSSVGQLIGDNATLNVQDNAILNVVGDFNIGDNPSVAVLNQTGGTIQANTLYVGKIGFIAGVNAGLAADGTYNMSGGILQSNASAGGDWRIGGGNGTGDVNATGTFNLSGTAVVNNVRNFQPGAFGKGTLNQTGGTWNQTGSFISIGRFAGSIGVWNINAGALNYTGTGNNQLIVGEAGNGTMNLSGTGLVNVKRVQLGLAAGSIGVFNMTGGTLTMQNTTGDGIFVGAGAGTFNLSGGVINMNGTDLGASVANFSFTGGKLSNANLINRPLTQTGASSILETNGTAATTTINGAYSLSEGTATVGASHTISVTGPFTLSSGATVNGAGTLVSTGTAAAYNLNRGTISASLGGGGAVNVVKETVGTVTLVGSGAYSPVITGSGVTDLRNGKLVLDYTGSADPTGDVAAILTAGRPGNFASGRIISTTANASRGIGYVDNTTTSQLSIAATLYGDTDLDLDVDFDDLLSLAKSYNGNNTVWKTGDFNYDQKTNFDDLLALAKNYNAKITTPVGAEFSSAFQADFALAQSLVPEPTTLGLIAGGLALAGRRRKA